MNNAVYVQKQNNWNTTAAYNMVNQEITNEWPEWKKRAYNEMFAVSAHAQKVYISDDTN